MDYKTKTRIEYELQFFGFSSDTILEGYTEMLKGVVCDRGVNSIVNMLRRKLVPAAVDPDAVERALQAMGEDLRCSYRSGVEYAVNKIEAKVRECFCIPDNLLLLEDRIVGSVENIDAETLNAEIAALKQELKNISIITEESKEELIIADLTLSQLEEAAAINVHQLPKEIIHLR